MSSTLPLCLMNADIWHLTHLVAFYPCFQSPDEKSVDWAPLFWAVKVSISIWSGEGEAVLLSPKLINAVIGGWRTQLNLYQSNINIQSTLWGILGRVVQWLGLFDSGFNLQCLQPTWVPFSKPLPAGLYLKRKGGNHWLPQIKVANVLIKLK